MNKKILSIMLLSAMAVSSVACLAGCGGTDRDEAYADCVGADIIGSVSTIDTSVGDGAVLKVGVKENVKGFGYKDTLSNSYDGMEIALSYMLAKAYGYGSVEFTTVTAATRGTLLDSGDLDAVLATFTITDARKESWDFSTPYYTDYVTVMVNKTSGISTLADLTGKTVGVSSGSTSAKSLYAEMFAKGFVTAYDADTFDASTSTEVKFQQFDDYAAISTALSAGTVDAFCVDKSILSNWMNNDRMYVEGATFAPQNYGVATKKGASVSTVFESAITTWLDDGTIAKLISAYGI